MNLPPSGVKGRKVALTVSFLLHGAALVIVGSWVISSRSISEPHPYSEILEDMPALLVEEEIVEVPEDVSDSDGSSGDENASSNFAIKDLVMAEAQSMSASTQVVLPLTNGLSSNVFGGGSGPGVEGKANGKGLGRLKSSQLFGMDLLTRNAGFIVYLDNSGSMQEANKRVRALVASEFPQATVFNLRGALFAEEKSIERLKRERKGDDFVVTYYRTMLANSIIPKCYEHLQTLETAPEAIYMMSDFKDYVDPLVVDDFGRLLVARKIKFYAHSIGDRPHSSIAALCRQTGGAVLMVPLEKLPNVPDDTLHATTNTP